MSLTPRDLDYFLEIARCGQLAQAATHQKVTAAAMSKAVRRLEDEVGLPLFERTGHGMMLTPFGVSFQERALRIKSEHDEALRHAGDVIAGRAGLLRIGATQAVINSFVSSALAHLQPRRPGMHVRLSVASSDQVLELTRQGRLDLSVVPVYGPMPHGLEHQVIGQDELVPIVRDGHPLLRRGRMDLTSLADCNWVLPSSPSAARQNFDAVFMSAGISPPVAAIEVDVSSSWSLSLLTGTDLLTMAPRSALFGSGGRGVRELGFQGLCLPRTIAACWRLQAYRSPLANEFVAALKAPDLI